MRIAAAIIATCIGAVLSSAQDQVGERFSLSLVCRDDSLLTLVEKTGGGAELGIRSLVHGSIRNFANLSFEFTDDRGNRYPLVRKIDVGMNEPDDFEWCSEGDVFGLRIDADRLIHDYQLKPGRYNVRVEYVWRSKPYTIDGERISSAPHVIEIECTGSAGCRFRSVSNQEEKSKNAQPCATDNPGDAQRLRGDN